MKGIKVNNVVELEKKHGPLIRKMYRTYLQMKARCCCKTNHAYPSYGGRGIFMCERWIESFAAFVEDMGLPPTPKHSVDRIYNHGPYEKRNCRWATMKEQNENRRDNILIEIGGEVQTMTEWCRRTGVPVARACQRITRDGWPPKEAVLRPILRKWNRRKLHENQGLPALKTGPAEVM